jgi:biotin carboxylase
VSWPSARKLGCRRVARRRRSTCAAWPTPCSPRYAARASTSTPSTSCRATLERAAEMISSRYPQNRVRLKAIGGGGGKGQRILARRHPSRARRERRSASREAAEGGAERGARDPRGGEGHRRRRQQEHPARAQHRETRHNEIQLLGNGEWCVSLGGRDCSLQMHEQKLLEVSVTQEELAARDRGAREGAAEVEEAKALAERPRHARRMEEEAARFGSPWARLGLDLRVHRRGRPATSSWR